VTIGSGGGYFAGMSDMNVAQRLFSPSDAVVAGSGYIGGTAIETNDGYLVSGSWKFCSGADFATIFTANAQLQDGSMRSFIFTPDQVTIHRDWDTFGLKATGSHTISVTDALVPKVMTFDIVNGRRTQDSPIFKYPFLTFAEASFAAVNIGICRHYIAEAKAAVAVYKREDEPQMMLRYDRVSDIIKTQEEILSTDVNRFHEAVEISWELTLHGGMVPEAVYAEAGRWAKKVTATALECAQRIYPYLGLTAAMESTDLNRCWRDLHTASQHVLLKEF
jgi:alkylation response protein AidB-like acyl-CoA dehydrogenase